MFLGVFGIFFDGKELVFLLILLLLLLLLNRLFWNEIECCGICLGGIFDVCNFEVVFFLFLLMIFLLFFRLGFIGENLFGIEVLGESVFLFLFVVFGVGGVFLIVGFLFFCIDCDFDCWVWIVVFNFWNKLFGRVGIGRLLVNVGGLDCGVGEVDWGLFFFVCKLSGRLDLVIFWIFKVLILLVFGFILWVGFWFLGNLLNGLCVVGVWFSFKGERFCGFIELVILVLLFLFSWGSIWK